MRVHEHASKSRGEIDNKEVACLPFQITAIICGLQNKCELDKRSSTQQPNMDTCVDKYSNTLFCVFVFHFHFALRARAGVVALPLLSVAWL